MIRGGNKILLDLGNRVKYLVAILAKGHNIEWFLRGGEGYILVTPTM